MTATESNSLERPELIVPDVVVEIRRPGRPWTTSYKTVIDNLENGVGTVCIVDPHTETLTAFNCDGPLCVLKRDDELKLDGFGLKISTMFIRHSQR